MLNPYLSRSVPGLALLSVLAVFGCRPSTESRLPPPTDGETQIRWNSEEGENQHLRDTWIAGMHRAAPGTDWKALEAQHRALLQVERQQGAEPDRDGMESLADGYLNGIWHERGSRNQAGSVVATAFDPESEDIWLISAGGSLWKGNLDGKHWEVIREDMTFEGELLHFIPGPSGRRMLAMVNKILHYSDDDGETWVAAEGMTTDYDNWGSRKDPVVVEGAGHTIFLLVQEWLSGPWKSDVGIYMSQDLGQSFTKTWSFQSEDPGRFAMTLVTGTDRVVILEKVNDATTRILELDTETGIPQEAGWNAFFGVGSVGAYVHGVEVGGETRLYTYDSANQFYLSTDMGATWQPLGTVDERPWGVGMLVITVNPDVIFVGGVHCHRSFDGGQTFARFNDWWDYYDNVNGALHADMMYFREFRKKDGTPFYLFSNHGGLNVSYDGVTVDNLGLSGLNVSQYYDVVTDPIDELYIYAGSQDQGFQRALDLWENDQLDFEQAISGDYGHMVFTDYGQRLWMVYPGGWITYWPSPSGGGYTASYEVDSEDESVWIPPLVAHPDPAQNVVFLAGGNDEGGEGSYIIRLAFEGGEIQATQLPFDFKAFSEGEVSAMAFSPHDPNRMYAATTNGYFFTSQDQGQTWEPAVGSVPGGHYLYGSVILPCPVEPDRVYFGGSGYSNAAVWVSEDGGQTFVSMNEGLPATLVLDMAATPDGKLLFAGTESAPYVFVRETGQWYPMSGVTAPLQRYWSVAYLPQQHRVRFGTYGRGIWDFAIDESVSTVSTGGAASTHQGLVYPNPCREPAFSFVLPGLRPGREVDVAAYDIRGNRVFSHRAMATGDGQHLVVPLPSSLPSGVYYLLAGQGGRRWSAAFTTVR